MSEHKGHIELERTLDSITVGARHRHDLGNLEPLMKSIANLGLLQPITITPDGVLICGRRRLEAVRQLGHRTTKVWVRSGISDRLAMMLAERDENTLREPLNQLEAHTLYEEIKALRTEDASRRQAASRFGAEQQNGWSHGEGDSPSPCESGGVREQAALTVTGNQSYQRLERIGFVKDAAADPDLPENLRGLASTSLQAIGAGGPVNPEYQQLRAVRDLIDQQPSVAGASPEELLRLGKQALARAEAERAGKKVRALQKKPARSTFLNVRSFVITWTELEGWTGRYNIDEIAASVRREDWDRFERVIAESTDFAARVRAVRARRTEPVAG